MCSILCGLFCADSLQISPLSGKLFFSNLHYTGTDLSLQITSGYVELRYWNYARPSDDNQTEAVWNIHTDGLQLFVYNRSDAYKYLDTVLQGLPLPTFDTKTSSSLASYVVFPIDFVVEKGSVTFGNSDLPTLLIFSYERLSSSAKEAGKIHIDIGGPVSLAFRINVDYREAILSEAARNRNLRKRGFFSSIFGRGDLSKDSLPISPHSTWNGLARYNMNSTGKEYAKEQIILETTNLEVSYLNAPESDTIDVALKFFDSKIQYGPWAHAQRLMIQQFFSPPSYRNAEEGVCRYMNITASFAHNCNWRIPFRDELYYGTLLKRYPWLLLSFGEKSKLELSVPMNAGHSSKFAIRLETLSVSSSVNGANLLECDVLKMDAAFESPLEWNASRKVDWYINALLMIHRNIDISNHCRVWLLRDTIDAFVHIMNDFSRYGEGKLEHFYSSVHQVKISLSGNIHLNCNEGNVIDSHNDFGENGNLAS